MIKQKVIGIDARFFGEAGPGRYAKDILEQLEKIDTENKYLVFMRPLGYEQYVPTNPNFTKVLANYKWYSWSEQIHFLIKLVSYKLDLFYVPHFNIPVLYPGKIVTAIPDIIMHAFSTERGTTLPKPYFRFKKWVYKLVVYWAVIRSQNVIVPSLDVKEDFLKVYPNVNPDKYVLAYEGIDPDCLRTDLDSKKVMSKFDIRSPFLLYVSSMYEHKNVPRLVDAVEILMKKYNFDGQLVLIGKKDKFSESIQKLIILHNLGDKVLIPGMSNYVTDKEVVALRKEAAVYVFPSLKEGFSLTPLEAQVVGLASVISDIPCHKEIYGDSVLYFDPQNPEDMAEKVNNIMKDEILRKEIIRRGYLNAQKYDWRKTASITLEVFSRALKGI